MNELIKVAGRSVGPNHKPFVIAEIGINHEGSLEKALRMVEDAHGAGAECVKFQRHVVESEMTPEAREVIPGNASESIYEIMERCALSKSQHVQIKRRVEELGMAYLCTPFSKAAADELEEIGVCAYKVGSGECNNLPLLRHIASFGKPVILSTGMNDIESVKKSVGILDESGVEYALLHCTSMYPTPYDKVRLGGIEDLRRHFPDVVLGLSDHSLGNYTCFAAVALGASILEKHFTSDLAWPGPDVPISIDPAGLKDLIVGCSAVHQSLGGRKSILEEEQATIDFAYACVVTISDVKQGEVFSSSNIWVKRPGTGEIKAESYEQLLGKRASRDLGRDMQVGWGDVADEL